MTPSLEGKRKNADRRNFMDQFSRCRSSLSSDQVSAILEQLKFFDFCGSKIRAMDHEGQRWIVFADICRTLGYKNANNEAKMIPSNEKCRLEIGLKNTCAVCINKNGLARFTLFANKEQAVIFRDWAAMTIFEGG